MILVDTSVFIDYFNGIGNRQTKVLDYLLERNLVLIGDYILVEILQGIRNDKDFNLTKEYLSAFPIASMCNKELAFKSAENYRLLKSKGYTIRKTIDVLIGTFCIENKIELLHNDRDFDPMQKHLKLKVRSK